MNTYTPAEQFPIGVWRQRRKKYLKEYHRGLYDGLLLTGKLYQHLSAIDEQAQERYDVIVAQMKKAQGITELLKSENSFIISFSSFSAILPRINRGFPSFNFSTAVTRIGKSVDN